MLFSNAPTVIYLKSKSLEVYNQKTKGVQARLDFPPNYQKDQEIIDQEKFENLLSSFLTKLNLNNQDIIIAIAGEDLYEKTITSDQLAKEKAAVDNFFNTVPFDPQKISKLQIKTKNGLKLIATNKNLYEAVVHVLQKIQSNIKTIIPATTFSVTSTSTLTQEDIKKITSNKDLLKSSNFINGKTEKISSLSDKSEKNEESPPESSEEPKKKNFVIIGGVSFMAVGLVIIGFLLVNKGYLTQILPNHNESSLSPSSQPIEQSIETESSDPGDEENEASDEAKTEDDSKSTITVQILNGSGISGQASSIKNTLQSLDYLEISVGNANSSDHQSTTISYGSNVSEDLANEIKTELEKTLSSVSIQDESDQQDFDIIITSGQPL